MKVEYKNILIECKDGFLTVKNRKTGEVILNPVQIPGKEEPYFFKISSKKRRNVKSWLKDQVGTSDRERKFLKIVKDGLKEVKYDYWISTIEPTMKDGKIQFIKGEKVKTGHSCNEWKKMAEDYCKERGSRLANLYELFIWYAWRIVKGYWTLSYVANNSSSGNYIDSPNHYSGIEVAGARKVRGFCDGVGNTCKIVTFEERYALCGGCYFNVGNFYPVGDVGYDGNPFDTQYYGSGVFVLTKPSVAA